MNRDGLRPEFLSVREDVKLRADLALGFWAQAAGIPSFGSWFPASLRNSFVRRVPSARNVWNLVKEELGAPGVRPLSWS